MNKPTVTATNHILPFGELSPADFERLCLWLVEREGYTQIQHLGAGGNEQGRDVTAWRGNQLWYFQCKRYKELSSATLIAEVEKYNQLAMRDASKKPYGVVFATNAVLTAKTREDVENFCRTHSYACEFWAQTELDMHAKRHDDIVKEFFNFSLPPPSQDKIEIARLPRLLTRDLFGRELESQMLDDAWANPQTNVISFVAWGGVGKSALVSHWLQALEKDNWRGAERVFAWSFYSQGTNDKSATAEYFINTALRWFGGDALADHLQMAGQWEKGERLAQLIRQTRTLLILDGLEPVQHPPLSTDAPEGCLKEQTMQALLRELAAHQPGLCVINTRLAISDLTQFEGRSVVRYPLDELFPAAGAQLLRRLKVNGTPEELEAASREYGGHSLALTLLGSYLSDVYAGDVRRRHEIESLEEDRKHGRHARKVLRAYEKWLGESGQNAMLDVLRMLGLFDRPADGATIAALRTTPAIAGLTDALQVLGEREWR